MKAMIFAAGLGTRLQPLTNTKPKALVEVNRVPLLEICIKRLIYFGFDDLIINVHHFGGQIIDFIEQKQQFGISITISEERKQLLNTGGGLKYAAPFFDDNRPFLVCNADIITDLNLKAFYNSHCQSSALVTLATRYRKTSRFLIFNEQQELIGWRNKKTGAEKWSRAKHISNYERAFSGIHVIDPQIFSLMPKEDAFSIIPLYLDIAKTHRILEFPHDEGMWLDVGKLPALAEAEKII